MKSSIMLSFKRKPKSMYTQMMKLRRNMRKMKKRPKKMKEIKNPKLVHEERSGPPEVAQDSPARRIIQEVIKSNLSKTLKVMLILTIMKMNLARKMTQIIANL